LNVVHSATAFADCKDAPEARIKIEDGAPSFGQQMDQIFADHVGIPFVRVGFHFFMDDIHSFSFK
jgi:hypothetical protein